MPAAGYLMSQVPQQIRRKGHRKRLLRAGWFFWAALSRSTSTDMPGERRLCDPKQKEGLCIISAVCAHILNLGSHRL